MNSWWYQEWITLKTNCKLIIFFYASSVLIGIITFLVFRHDIAFSQSAFKSISQSFHSGDQARDPLWLKSIFLFARNSLVAFSIIGIGLIPIVVIPFVLLTYQTVLVALIFCFGYQMGQDPIHGLLLGVMPHGLFELTAAVVASVLGTRLSLRKFQSVREKEYVKILRIDQEDMKTFRTYLVVVVPLLFVAAFLETYITPVLLN